MSVADALDFLTHWSSTGPWSLMAIEATDSSDQKPRWQFGRFDPTIITDLTNWLEERDGVWNLYFVPNQPIDTITTTPKKTQIIYVNCLHMDLDLAKGTQPSPHAFELLLARIQSFVPHPTVITFSGGGYQAFWLFPTPLSAIEYADRVEQANRAIEKTAGADHCHDIGRLMRLPGTMNMPNALKRSRGRTPERSTIIHADWSIEARWVFGTDPIPVLPPSTHLDPNNQTPTQSYDVNTLIPKLKKAIRTGDATDYAGDRSSLVWFVITNLIRKGWPDEAIYPLLLDTSYLISAHCRDQQNPASYAQKQLAKARQAVASDWNRTVRGGINTNDPDNITRALGEIGAKFAYDSFALRGYVNGAGPLRPVDDEVFIDLRLSVNRSCSFLPTKDLFQDIIQNLTYQNKYHPVRNYLTTIAWDHIPRIGTPIDTPSWLTTYGGAKDSEYVRAVGRLFLLAAVRRVRQPGCKFDEMMVLVNPEQGTDKSTALRVLAVKQEWFTDSLPLNATGKQVIEQMSGKWICEASELHGMRTREVEELKSFLSRQTDRDRMSYDRYTTDAPRQCVIAGTTNSTIFLKDAQNRRFWPVKVKRFDIPALQRDLDQLWAEAAYYEALQEDIRLPQPLWAIAADHQADARAAEPWAELIGDALTVNNHPLLGTITALDAWKILNKPRYQRTQEDNRRFGDAMRELGFERTRARVEGTVSIVYTRGQTPAERRRQIYVRFDPVTESIDAGHTQSPSRDARQATGDLTDHTPHDKHPADYPPETYNPINQDPPF